MKLCLISPIDGLWQYASLSDNIHLTLAHLVSDYQYTSFYVSRKVEYGDYIIMDNGAYEFHKPLDSEELVRAAIQINADCIVAPDYPFENYEKTIVETEKFINYLRNSGYLGRFEVMAVPQSEVGHFYDWLKCYEYFSKHRDISIIGMSILAIPNACRDIVDIDNADIEDYRLYVTEYLKRMDMVSSKRHHYLGAGAKLHYISKYDIAYSLDTSSPIWHGMNNIRYDKDTALQHKLDSKVDFHAKIDQQYTENIIWNIMCLHRWSKIK